MGTGRSPLSGGFAGPDSPAGSTNLLYLCSDCPQ